MSMTPVTTRSSSFKIRLEQFEGPLDLMLYLIQSQELDISTVSITKITNQYLHAIKLMQELDFDIASDFLVMAATLILWKSKALMPKENDDQNAAEDQTPVLTQEDLVRQLLERQRYLEAAAKLAQYPLLEDEVFKRPTKRPPVEKVWKPMNMSQLTMTYQDLLIRENKRARIVMKKETVSLQEKIQEMGRGLKMNVPERLDHFIADKGLRGEWVVGFLATLELSRLKLALIHQQETFDPIFVELIKEMIDFDTKQTTGFDYVRSEQA
jgi:segregation and condensation protein A